MISFPCPVCNQSLTVDPHEAGQQSQCPHCQAFVEVPEAVPPVRQPSLTEDAALAPESRNGWGAAAEPSDHLVEPDAAPGEEEAEEASADEQPAAFEETFLPTPRKPGLAALLSLVVPGLGQLYNGQPIKGVLFFSYQAAIVVLTIIGVKVSRLELWLLSKRGLLWVGVISFIIVALLCVYDAYQTARRKNAEWDTYGYG